MFGIKIRIWSRFFSFYERALVDRFTFLKPGVALSEIFLFHCATIIKFEIVMVRYLILILNKDGFAVLLACTFN